MIASSSGVRGSSSRQVAREIWERTGQRVSDETVRHERHQHGLKPFYVVAKPLKTNTHIEDRKWLADFVADWTEEDFLHSAPSDEFCVYVIRKSNHHNERIGAKNIFLILSVL